MPPARSGAGAAPPRAPPPNAPTSPAAPPAARDAAGATSAPTPIPEAASIDAAFRRHALAALDATVGVLHDPEARPAERLRAAQLILERGCGRPGGLAEDDGPSLVDLLAAP